MIYELFPEGDTMIVDTLEAMVETDRPPFGTRLRFLLFKVMQPLSPRRTRSERFPL